MAQMKYKQYAVKARKQLRRSTILAANKNKFQMVLKLNFNLI